MTLIQYIRALFYLMLLCLAYIVLIFALPEVGKTIDGITGKDWNEQLWQKLEEIASNVMEKKDALEDKIENPAPNTSRNIEGRTGQ